MHVYHHPIRKMLNRKKVVMELITQRRCEIDKFEKERKKIDETH